jgi:pimeloyl-ACP methyl ester carboxylesterase
MTGTGTPAAGGAPAAAAPGPPAGSVNWTAGCRYEGHDVRVPAWYRKAGGELLVLLHGLGRSKESFRGAFTETSLRGYSICSLDFPGHGASGRGLPAGLCTLESCAAVTRLVIGQLTGRHGPVHLAGHSMGGAVAVLVAGDMPGAGWTVSIDGNLVGEDRGLASRNIAGQDLAGFAADGHSRFPAGLRQSARPDYAAWAAWYASADPAAVHAAAASLVAWWDSGGLLARFNALDRKAFLYGDREAKGHLLGRLEEAVTSAVPDSGHFAMVDNPGPFYEALARILVL